MRFIKQSVLPGITADKYQIKQRTACVVYSRKLIVAMSLRIVFPSPFTEIVDTQKVTSKSPIRKPSKVDLKIACHAARYESAVSNSSECSFFNYPPLCIIRLSEEFSQTYLIRPSSFLFCLRRIRFLLNKSKKLNCLHVNTIHYNCIYHLLAIIVIKTIILF